MSNWGVLWRSLRSGVPDGRYHDGASVVAVDGRADGVSLTFADGSRENFDVVFGADGYRSVVRGLVADATDPAYAGYILWRGNFPESRLSDRIAIDALDDDQAWLTVGFERGHAVMYPIPDFDDGATPGHRRINWAIYAPQPEGLVITEPSSIPPGAVTQALYDQFLDLLDKTIPPSLRPLFDSPIDEVSIQPVYDESIDRYVRDRLVLIGDAGALARPHTGSGATKAMQDARLLEQLGAENESWESLLQAYEADRVATADTLVQLGRRIGRDQVEDTPPWAAMTPDDYVKWTEGTLSGDSLYFWGTDEAD